jgi:hypothetical protein
VVGRRGTACRASSSSGGDRLGAWREVHSTGGAHGGVCGAVPWPEVSGDGGVPMDVAAASDTLPVPLLCCRVRVDPCLRKGWRPLRSWTRCSRHGSTAHQRWQRGAGASTRRGLKSRATTSTLSRALHGGRQLDTGAPLEEVRLETHGPLLWWLARRSSTSRVRSSRAAMQDRREEWDGSGERVGKLGFSSTRRQG